MRHARADLVEAPGTKEAFARAVQIDPGFFEASVGGAVLAGYAGDPSPAVDEQMVKASRIDPMSSEVLMALGLRDEFRGDNVDAGRYLSRAAEIDRKFMPSWTLASFYVRQGQPDKFWPLAQHCLSLDPLNINPWPVFDLAWRVVDDMKNGDAAKIQSLLPESSPRIADYLEFLLETKRWDAAVAVWPKAVDVLGSAMPNAVAWALAYPTHMISAGRTADAVRGWNDLVGKKLIHSGPLNPANGRSIADPEFNYSDSAVGVFAWQPAQADGIFATGGAGALRFELNGEEPQPVKLLSTTAAVLPARAYRLVWKYDASQLLAPLDPGFDIRILQRTGDPTICAPFLRSGEKGQCNFKTDPTTDAVLIELHYARASGTVRAKGTLVLSDIHLEPGS